MSDFHSNYNRKLKFINLLAKRYLPSSWTFEVEADEDYFAGAVHIGKVVLLGKGMINMLNRRELKFVFLHEVGHAKLHHDLVIELSFNKQKAANYCRHDLEFEADAFAKLKGAQPSAMLKAFIKLCKVYDNQINLYSESGSHPAPMRRYEVLRTGTK